MAILHYIGDYWMNQKEVASEMKCYDQARLNEIKRVDSECDS